MNAPFLFSLITYHLSLLTILLLELMCLYSLLFKRNGLLSPLKHIIQQIIRSRTRLRYIFKIGNPLLHHF